MCARCKSTLEARKERESKPVHPAHQANREKLAARIVDALFTRVFGDRTPTGDEVRNVASTTMLHRGSWVQLAGLTGNGSMSRETRALVLGELINRAEDLDAAAEARAA
jgi:hypothetical protein